MNYSNYEVITDMLKDLNNENQFDYVNASDKEHDLTILKVQEEDRQRIARDLHDTSLQNLAHLVHKIELASMYIDQDPLKAKLELAVINKSLKAVIDEIRNTIFDLRPMSFDDLGLKSAFEESIKKFNENNTYEIVMDIDDISCENEMILATIYRVVKECFINIRKHSEADKIIFYCKSRDNICVIDIEDNGKGFTKKEIEDKQKRHFGITVVEERVCLLGGNVSISSKKEKGTHIHMEIPLI